jgi:dTDP-glucose pyrophosphorylase
MWAIIPAAGRASRIQPLAFSKELLPVGVHLEDRRQPRAVSDYLVDRLVRAGASRLCFVIGPGKSDILEYYSRSPHVENVCYTVQPHPAGLCDALFRALPFLDLREDIVVGLPDTIWFPVDALAQCPPERFSFVLFPVEEPQNFDAVLVDAENRVQLIQVKQPGVESRWIWGAFRLPGAIFRELFDLWNERGRIDEYLGTLVNAWIERGGAAYGLRTGAAYHDVGTMDGYLKTVRILNAPVNSGAAESAV